MVKNILQVFPEGVIIRSTTSAQNPVLIDFINDTAKMDFRREISVNEAGEVAMQTGYDFILKDPNNSSSNPEDSDEATMRLEQIMEISEKKLREHPVRETENQMEMMHPNEDDNSTIDSKHYTLKTIRVSWEDHEDAYLHVFVSTTDIKRLEKAKATNK